MSRQYDEAFLDIPDSIPEEPYVWRDGVGYYRIDNNNDYYITSQGDVISFRNSEPKILATYENKHGHQYVDLSYKGYRDKRLVHRLVAQEFIPNPEGYPIVRHLDDDPKNNYYRNLAWGTQKDNREDSTRNGNDYRRGVYCFETDRHYRSCADAAKELGVSRPMITRACGGYSNSVRGLHLCYEDEINKKRKDNRWIKKNGNFKPVVAIDSYGNMYVFSSRKAASLELDIPDCSISSVLAGRIKTTHGWRFEEGE